MSQLYENEIEFNEKSRVIAVEQILRALNYMHLNELVHRDLKVENVVYSKSSVEDDDEHI